MYKTANASYNGTMMRKAHTPSRRDKLKILFEKKVVVNGDVMPVFQHNVFTPFELCSEIVSMVDVVDRDILVMNLEFALVLIEEFDVNPSRITIFADVDPMVEKLASRMGINYIDAWNDDMKFDVVFANPPYQDPDKPRHKLWVNFLCNSLDQADTVAMITPKAASLLLSGLEFDHKRLDRSRDNLVYYNGHNVDRHFKGVGSDFCSFILSKEHSDTFDVVTKNGIEQWEQGSFIPYAPCKILASIIHKNMNFANEYGRRASRVNEDPNGNLDCIKTIKASGPEWVKASSKHSDTDKPKILLPTLGSGYYLNSEGGVMPTTSFVTYITTDTVDDLNEIVDLLNDKVFKFLVDSFSSMRSARDFVLKSLRKERIPLTQEEIDYIEANV